MHRTFFRFACFAAVFSFKQGRVLSFEPLPSARHVVYSTRLFTSAKPEVVVESASATTSMIGSSSSSGSDPNHLPAVAATAKRLFLVRHGEVINPGGDKAVYYGAMDVPLSALGEQEAVGAAQYLAQYELAAVFSSKLSRAIYGAEQVCQLQGAQCEGNVVQLEGFKELDRGDWCGKTLDEIGTDLMARFDACDESVTPANGESYPALKRRVLAARWREFHNRRRR